MKEVECKIISISINLYEYLKREYSHNVYNVAIDFLLERYIYVTDNYKKEIIMLEIGGKVEDSNLLDYISNVILKSGTKKNKSSKLSNKINGVYFNPKWNEKYSATYTGLEIIDLYSYPIHKFIKRNKKDQAFLTYENKIDGYPNYINRGIKVFPSSD